MERRVKVPLLLLQGVRVAVAELITLLGRQVIRHQHHPRKEIQAEVLLVAMVEVVAVLTQGAETVLVLFAEMVERVQLPHTPARL